jgi:hypothetical protein
MDELTAFLKRPDAHDLGNLPELHRHLKRASAQLAEAMSPIPANGKEAYIRRWLADNGKMTGLWKADVDDIVDHILVAVGRRDANGDTLGYVSYDSYVAHGWRSCPRLYGRPYRIKVGDDPGLLAVEKCRFCWSEDDQRRLEGER